MKYTVYAVRKLDPIFIENCSKKKDVYSADTKKEAFKWLKKNLTTEYTSKDTFFTIEEED